MNFDFSQAGLLQFFSQYAYEPGKVYGFIIIFMTASSFGFPVPEELVLISAGLVAYLAQHPEQFPPPFEGATPVEVYLLATVCFLAVVGSDFLVYSIGKFFGKHLNKIKFFKKSLDEGHMKTINKWFEKYGGWACGIFRFTPGLRFPGHLSCGLTGIPVWKFLLIDMAVAAISVPTQVILVATYGEVVLAKFHEFKMVLLALGVIAFIIWFVKKKKAEKQIL
jgi:membrane protein DedA with SNARE-associated domain